MTEIAIDLDEGADMIIVKPALAYLDVDSHRSRSLRCPDSRVQRVRRVRDDQGRLPTWLDR